MERSVEVFAAIQMTVIGLSHATQPGAWVEFFRWLKERGRAGVFVNGFLSLGFGAFIVAFHNVWHGPVAVLTVLGWLQVVKGLVSFVAPRYALRSLERVSEDRAREFIAPGIVFLVLAGVVWYAVLVGGTRAA